ncbi:GntR family transcriptional regulator [Caldalkalibacillus salinus]|uniref:GntR family transcriptional regulator n=1 Tax=Caldalkalibacillus salinus TaxID=2803787 RepID=UPI0019242E3F|nr:GntR family transcriptional regulator [Caldalkalibacillus salinus]
MIDKESPIPIYYQLEEHFRTLIEEGKLQPGDMIPSERELSEAFHISRMTIRQAITNLANEGLITRVKGKGTFVAEKKIEQSLGQLTGFSEDMRLRGMEPSTEILDFKEIEATTTESRELQLNPGDAIYHISRLRLADGQPMALEQSYLRKNEVHGLTESIVRSSIYDYIENDLGLSLTHARQTIEPSLASDLESRMLKVEPHTPVLLIKRNSYLSDGTPLEYVKSVYRGDRYKFVTEMKRGH